MNLLQLIQTANAEMGIGVPNYVAGNQATDIVQEMALLNAVGNELRSEFPWQALNKEYRFTTVYSAQSATVNANSSTVVLASTAGLDTTYMVIGTGVLQDTYIQSVDDATHITLSNAATSTATGTLTFCKTKYTLPSDFERIIDRTMWDKSKHWEMLGPETPQQWQWLKSGYISTGPRIRFRIEGGTFQMWPPISSNELIGYEYVSNGWASSSTGTPQAAFVADTDTCIFRDRLMIAGLKLKYFQVKGFDTTVMAAEFTREFEKAKGQDSASPILSFAPQVSQVLIGVANIPDSGYGS